MAKGGLGVGFDALFSDNTNEIQIKKTLRTSELEPNRSQPRKSFSEEAIYSSKSEKLRKQRYIEYIAEQIKEMIAFKENKSKISYPSVPLPGGESISNGKDIATESMNRSNFIDIMTREFNNKKDSGNV